MAMKVRSNKTKLVQHVTPAQLAVMQANAGRGAFTILEQDTTPDEVKAVKAKAKAAKAPEPETAPE